MATVCAVSTRLQVSITLPPIRGSQPEIIRSWCAHHPPPPKVFFTGRLNARAARGTHAHAAPLPHAARAPAGALV